MRNEIQQAFDSVQADAKLKRETSEYLSRKLYCPPKKGVPMRRIAAAFACFATLLLGGGYYIYFTPVSSISIDVNPSIELSINRFDRVVSMDGYNEDGKALVLLLSLNHLPYEQAIAVILAEEQIQHYLNDGELLSMTVVGNSQKQNEQMLTTLSQYITQENILCHAANAQEVASAHKRGLSVGKYSAFLSLYELDPSVTIEEIKHLTMRQISNRIGEFSGDEILPQGNGNGNNAGGNQGGNGANNGGNQGGNGANNGGNQGGNSANNDLNKHRGGKH